MSAVILLCGCPPGVRLSLDSHTVVTGALFAGFRQVPPGLHLLSSSQGHGGGSGVFLQLHAGEVLVRRWDEATEEIGGAFPAEEAAVLEAAVLRGERSDGLGAYPRAELGARWQELTSHVTLATLARAGLAPGVRLVPDAQPGEGSCVPCFTPVAARRLAGMTPCEVTEYNRSPGQRLARLLRDEHGGSTAAFLGEYQLAFLLFLQLSCFAAFEHWKAALHLVAAADASMEGWPELALGLLGALAPQLELTPADMFTDELTADGFLRPALAALARGAASAVQLPLRAAGRDLAALVEERFGMRLSPSSSSASLDGSEDERPVVVAGAVQESCEQAGAAAEGAAEAPRGRSSPESLTQGERMGWMIPPAV